MTFDEFIEKAANKRVVIFKSSDFIFEPINDFKKQFVNGMFSK